jgi:hypothetical protein
MMKSRQFAYILLIFVLFLTGCKEAETNSPLGCKKEEGRYFDPEKGECVTVTSGIHAYRLNSYRYVSRLIADGVAETEFRVYFLKSLTEAEFLVLLKELRPVQVKGIALHFNNGDNLAGNGSGIEVNGELVRRALQATLDWHRENIPSNNEVAESAAYMKDYEEGRFVIDGVSVTSTPTAMKAWWDAHRSSICAIQGVVDWFDKAQISECIPNKDQ